MRFLKSKAERQATAEKFKCREEQVAAELKEREMHYRQVAFEGLCETIATVLAADKHFVTVFPEHWFQWNDLVSAIVRAANEGIIEDFWFPPPGDLRDSERKAILKIRPLPAASSVAA